MSKSDTDLIPSLNFIEYDIMKPKISIAVLTKIEIPRYSTFTN
jgi:hypothetical protein